MISKKVLSSLFLSSVTVLGGATLVAQEEQEVPKPEKVVASSSTSVSEAPSHNEGTSVASSSKPLVAYTETPYLASNNVAPETPSQAVVTPQLVVEPAVEVVSLSNTTGEPLGYTPSTEPVVESTVQPTELGTVETVEEVPSQNTSETTPLLDSVEPSSNLTEPSSDLVEPSSTIVEDSLEPTVEEPVVEESISEPTEGIQVSDDSQPLILLENVEETPNSTFVETLDVAPEAAPEPAPSFEVPQTLVPTVEHDVEAQTGSITPTYNYNTSGSYPVGQCTWGVKVMAPWVGDYWGNGGQWAASAAAAGFRTGSTPQVGAVASWNDGGYGHVALVTAVESENAIQVYEANYAGNQSIANYRGTFDPTTAQGTVTYIYPN